MRYLVLCVLLTIPAIPKVWGQRVVASVSPAEESLKFDSNALPLTTQGIGQGDFSFAPNVVFTQDSLRGFVAYPAREEDGEEGEQLTVSSNKVMAFDAVTAEVLALIEVGPSPLSLTLTPDGTQLGVVSHVPDREHSQRGEQLRASGGWFGLPDRCQHFRSAISSI